MTQDSWNRQLPPNILLGGEKKFDPPLTDPTQIWVIPGGNSPSSCLGVQSKSGNKSGGILLQAEYRDLSLDEPSPGKFPLTPTLDLMSWDWIEFHCCPLVNLDVKVITWVPDPRVICSRHIIQNTGSNRREITHNLTFKTEKGEVGTLLSQETYRGWKILSGKSAHHSMLLFLTGSEAFPGGLSNRLINTSLLEPSEVTELRWILVFCDSKIDPHQFLEETIKLDWDGEIAHRKISLSNQLQIKTGNREHDFSLASSQRQARLILNQLYLQAENSGSANLILDPLHAWQLFLAFNPPDSSSVEWLLSTTLLGNLRKAPSFPLEAELLWRAQQAGISLENLKEFLPVIENNLITWFSKERDKDNDGIPEETPGNLFQLGLTQRQDSMHWVGTEQENDNLETPGLAAFLHNEICQLEKLGEMISKDSLSPELTTRMRTLEKYILSSWHEGESRFRSRDYQSHFSREGYSLKGSIQNGWNILRTTLPFSSRLRLIVTGTAENRPSQHLRITLQGVDWQGRYRVEELTSQDFLWQENSAQGTTLSIYSQLDYCAASGLARNKFVKIEVPSSDRQDLSLTLPYWLETLPANIGEILASSSLGEKGLFRSKYGLKITPLLKDSPVQLSLNLLVVQGLIKAGYAPLAGEILVRLMDAASQNILHDGYLYSTWDSKTGQGFGKPNQLTGLLPIRLLLDLLGVRFLVTGDLILEERTPLLFPVQLIYKGIEITIQERETILCCRDGDRTILARGKKEVVRL